MKKDRKIYSVIALLLLVVMVSLVLVSSTYAKYTSSTSGSDSAIVAKWAVKVNGTQITTAGQSGVTFNLFDESKVYDLAGLTDEQKADFTKITSPTVDTDVKDATSGNAAILAPGTWGYVTFELENDSDVTAQYDVTVDSLTTTLPLKFSVDGKNWKSVADITTAINDSTKTDKNNVIGSGTLAIGSTTAQKASVSLYWKWDFTDADTDANETALGVAGTATCSITAGVVFTQVD